MRIGIAAALVVMIVAGSVTLTAGPAGAALACQPVYSAPTLSGAYALTDGYLFCRDPSDPRDGSPLNVELQQRQGRVWVPVATGLGEAAYICADFMPTVYRNPRLPTQTVTLFCS
jgi:hypothetical protein